MNSISLHRKLVIAAFVASAIIILFLAAPSVIALTSAGLLIGTAVGLFVSPSPADMVPPALVLGATGYIVAVSMTKGAA